MTPVENRRHPRYRAGTRSMGLHAWEGDDPNDHRTAGLHQACWMDDGKGPSPFLGRTRLSIIVLALPVSACGGLAGAGSLITAVD